MKNKSLLVESTIVVLSVIFTIFAFYFRKEINTNEIPFPFSMGMVIGSVIGFVISYWSTKKAIIETEQVNGEKAIETWQYLMISFLLSALGIFTLYVTHEVENLKIMIIFFLAWIGIIGNFRATIEPYTISFSVYMDDVDVNKKTKRFSGKLSVLCSLIGIIVVLILPQKFSLYVVLACFLFTLIVPYFYAKQVHYQKFA